MEKILPDPEAREISVSWSVLGPKDNLSILILPSISVTIMFIALKTRIWHTQLKCTEILQGIKKLQVAPNISKWVILWQLFKIPSFVYMKGKFVTNVSFATVRLINHSWDRFKCLASCFIKIYFFYVFYSREVGIFVFTVTIP